MSQYQSFHWHFVFCGSECGRKVLESQFLERMILTGINPESPLDSAFSKLLKPELFLSLTTTMAVADNPMEM